MDLDDILALAETHQPSPLELARARRLARGVQNDYDLSVTGDYEIIVDADLVDPLTATADEATRITRAAQLAKLGTLTWTANEPTHVSWSHEMATIFGHAPGAGRTTVKTLTETIHTADVATVREHVETAWSRRRPGEVTFRAIQPGGSIRYVHCHIEILTDAGEPSGIIATGEDATTFELARQEHRRLATRDAMLRGDLAARDTLTGLSTGDYFTDEVDRARRTTGGAVVVVATEPTTRLPTALTDDERDRLSAEVASLLSTIIEPGTTAGLAGPGLWGILLTPPTSDRDEAPDTLAIRIVHALRRQVFNVGEKALRLTTSAGVVQFRAGVPATGGDLIVDGEHAARDARRAGTAIHILHEPAAHQQRSDRCRATVRHAVSANTFTLHAQPLVDLTLSQVTRHEILLRLHNDAGEPVAPSSFLHMAERVGEILAVDQWVIDHALKLIGRGAQTSHYQINISGQSLADPDLLDYVTEAIHHNGVKPQCLTFEITETALIENRTEALAFATGIRNAGCHLALDDFGTGYAPLASLKYLPVDLVKIDGSFIVDLCTSPPDQALVSHLVGLCHTLGIQVAAEHVQDEQTIQLLRSYGVDFAQGYQTGRPTPITASVAAEGPTVELELRRRPPTRRTALG